MWLIRNIRKVIQKEVRFHIIIPKAGLVFRCSPSSLPPSHPCWGSLQGQRWALPWGRLRTYKDEKFTTFCSVSGGCCGGGAVTEPHAGCSLSNREEAGVVKDTQMLGA